jgi:manganese-dependent inorganic pyrophosphatase
LNTPIYIFGHTVPDTDSICASICYANLKNKLGYINATPYRLGSISKETQFVLNYFDTQKPELLKPITNQNLGESCQKKIQVILVDHNEKNQSLTGIDHTEIIEIIDHHRFAGLYTNEPIFIRAEPIGSTCTIVAKMYKENNIEIEKNIAGLMLSAILSDTLIFTSPTCTDTDKAIGIELAAIAGVNYQDFGDQLFEASTNLDDLTPKEILAIDRKSFTFEDNKAVISQVNTMDYKKFHHQKETLVEAMEKHASTNNIQLSIIIVTGAKKDILQKLFDAPINENSIYLDGVVSRKKQIVPLLSKL